MHDFSNHTDKDLEAAINNATDPAEKAAAQAEKDRRAKTLNDAAEEGDDGIGSNPKTPPPPPPPVP